MKRLQDMGASYFILDLRDNLGGLVQVDYSTILHITLYLKFVLFCHIVLTYVSVDVRWQCRWRLYSIECSFSFLFKLPNLVITFISIQAGIEIAKLFLNEGDTVCQYYAHCWLKWLWFRVNCCLPPSSYAHMSTIPLKKCKWTHYPHVVWKTLSLHVTPKTMTWEVTKGSLLC